MELEERYAMLQGMADALGCDLTLTLTVGGINVGELYNINQVPDEVETLDGQLDTMARLLVDPRTAMAATAANRMTYVEEIGKQLSDIIKIRRDEYNTAIDAFRSISSRPPSEVMEDVATSMVTVAREDDLLDMLLGIGIEEQKARKAERRAKALAKAGQQPATNDDDEEDDDEEDGDDDGA